MYQKFNKADIIIIYYYYLAHRSTPARDVKRKSSIQRAGFTLKAETWYPHKRIWA